MPPENGCRITYACGCAVRGYNPPPSCPVHGLEMIKAVCPIDSMGCPGRRPSSSKEPRQG